MEMETVHLLTEGAMSTQFVWVQIVLGSIIPLAILAFLGGEKPVPAFQLASLLVLVGVFTMKYVIVIGGQMIPLF